MSAGYRKGYDGKDHPASTEPVEKAKLVVDYGLHPSSQTTETIDFRKKSPPRGFVLAVILMLLLYAGYRIITARTAEDPVPVKADIPEQEIKERTDLAHLRGENRYQELYNKYLSQWKAPELDSPDTVAMADGRMLTGKIVSITDTSVTVKTIKETVECPVSEMKYYSKIKFSAREYADYMALKMFDHEFATDINRQKN